MSRFDRRRESGLRQLHALGPVVAASLCRRMVRCGNPNCRCARGDKHSSWCLTFKQQGRTRTVHVPQAMLQEVEQWVKEYRRAKQLLQQISQQSLRIIQGHVRAQRAAARVNAVP
jgi:hypothetical protein